MVSLYCEVYGRYVVDDCMRNVKAFVRFSGDLQQCRPVFTDALLARLRREGVEEPIAGNLQLTGYSVGSPGVYPRVVIPIS